MFNSYGAPVNIMKDGVMSTKYFNVTFSLFLIMKEKYMPKLDISIDVTEKSNQDKK